MRISGWIFLICAWGAILSAIVFCFKRVFDKGIDAGDDT